MPVGAVRTVQPGAAAGSRSGPALLQPSLRSQVWVNATARVPGLPLAAITRSRAERFQPPNHRPEEAGSMRTLLDGRFMCRLAFISTYRSAFRTWVGVFNTTW